MMRCVDCRFFHPTTLGALEQQVGTAPTGECRKNAPVVVVKDGTAVWPFLHDANEGWCGAFEPTDEEPTVN